MRVAPGMLLLGFALAGCHAARDVAVTSFRVIDAPANYVRSRLDGRQTTTTTTTTADVVTNPGRPVEIAPPPPRRTTTQTRANSATTTTSRTSSQRTAPPDTPPRNSSTASSRTAASAQQQQFPTAKPVPGKPGFVFSPYDPSGGYVDVTGYASGSKAKDPYSQKVFIVP